MSEIGLSGFFDQAYDFCSAFHRREVDVVQARRFEDQSAESFFWEYVYVVLNTGMKNAVAERIFNRYVSTRDLSVIGHLGKRKAIKLALNNSERWFAELKDIDNKLLYLETLPFIGSVTRYHLARNLGLDYAKPDRHLKRLAEAYGYGSDVQRMCEDLAVEKNLRVGTVDVVLWRFCASGCPQS